MATYYGDNYNSLYVEVPSQMADVGEVAGKVRVLYDEHACEANVIATSDTILMGSKLPKGARVLNAKLAAPSLGTTGIMKLGFLANGVDAADDDAFIASADAGGQAVLASMPAGSAGLGKKFEAETELSIAFSEATDSALGDVIKIWIEYVLD